MTDEFEWFVVMYRISSLVEEHRLGPFPNEQVAGTADAKLNEKIDETKFYTRVIKKRRKSLIKELLG